VQANATQARNGTSDLLQNEVQQSTLGWTAAGAYYLEIAKLNAATLSLLNATPITTSPTYDGIPTGLSYDLAPLESAAKQFMTTLSYVVQSSDPTQTPNGVPHTLTDAKNDAAGADVLSQVFGQMNLTNAVLQKITGFILPQTQIWTDPFGGLMSMGQLLINTSLIAMGAAAILSSATASTGAAIWSALTFNWGAAAATVAGHALMSFLGTPIFAGLLAILVPGITIAYILPMIPYVMWMAGVAGWIILVCEAMIAVPLWMLAHMTVGGDGLHGRAIEGWGLLFNVVFRPTLMVIGLFLGYFVFDCMSWLIRESFGIAAGFVLANGWLVSNFIGLGVLLTIFVMTHVVAALMSFRMVALLPHHLPRLIGFTAANRVDMDDFQQRAAWAPSGQIAGTTARALGTGTRQFGQQMQQLRGRSTGLISGPTEASGAEGGSSAGMDTTLRATSSSPPDTEDETNV
jgi:conjugal transfer/type IV secretion protein DotA/TraY